MSEGAQQTKKFALWSADYNRITGQALVTARVAPLAFRQFIYRGGLSMLPSWVVAWLRLWICILTQRVETLYVVCSRSNAGFIRDLPALASTWFGVRVVVHSHGSDLLPMLQTRAISRLAKQMYKRCEVITPSSHLLSSIAPFCQRTHLCENFSLGEMERRHLISTGCAERSELRVLWNSNILSSKGFFDVVQAVQSTHEAGLYVTLDCVGQPLGDCELSTSEVRGRVHQITFPWFRYFGACSPEFTIKMLHQSDVVCLPSRYESECQPLAIIDAMCAGKAIIVADTAALRATVRDYPATFVSPPYGANIAQHLVRLAALKVNSPQEFLAAERKASANAKVRFSSESFDKRIQEILLPTGG